MDFQDRCMFCDGAMYEAVKYASPDKYEQLCGIKDVERSWVICRNCGWAISKRNYDTGELEKVYLDSYRDKDFRGESVSESFDRIWNLPDWKSENRVRFDWFSDNVKDRLGDVLDIGSGFGVWPYMLNIHGWDVTCVEPNQECAKFITKVLRLDCYGGFFGADVVGAYDIVSLVHILEHMDDPVGFLKDLKRLMKPWSEIFIEVPDSSEFLYLDKTHDEFNSCHIVFFNMKTLVWAMELAGFTVIDIHRQHYNNRKLTRLMAVGRNETHKPGTQN